MSELADRKFGGPFSLGTASRLDAASGSGHAVEYQVRRGLPYADGIVLQKRLLEEVADRPAAPGKVVFAEHLPVITCGRSGDGGNLLASPEALRAKGIAYYASNRGGDVTYHGPGQWTVYPILRLDWYGRDLHRYLRLLEECALRFLAAYDIHGERRQGLTGAWVGREKVAAVGVAVSRWVTWHGFALNICPDLSCFTGLMHPCGIRAGEGGVGSLSVLSGRMFSMEETLPVLLTAVAEVLGLQMEESP